MGRRVTNGIAGSSGGGGLGNLIVDDATISTAVADDDIIFDPTGTGRLIFDADAQLQAQADLRFADADNSNFVAFQAPASIATNYTLTLPDAVAASNGFALVSDTGGTLSWAAAGATISDQTVSSSTFYPTFFNATSGAASALSVSSTKMTFQPSTGTFTVTNIVESSSIALKENVAPIENALDSVMSLFGVTYDRRDGSRQNEAGLIAEDVIKVLPNLVTKNLQGNIDGIQYTKLTAYLIEAVKTLKQEIDSLKGIR